MYAMKYGTVPIVSETGGLKDTVQNYNPYDGIFVILNFKSRDLIFEHSVVF